MEHRCYSLQTPDSTARAAACNIFDSTAHASVSDVILCVTGVPAVCGVVTARSRRASNTTFPSAPHFCFVLPYRQWHREDERSCRQERKYGHHHFRRLRGRGILCLIVGTTLTLGLLIYLEHFILRRVLKEDSSKSLKQIDVLSIAWNGLNS